ncbi:MULTISPECIES: hypothetical protein [Burkholderia]|nr:MULTISPECIES: hypothetical protein [Burkholderia]MBY4712776.1 hypothetical protein [Burkholderia cepacia]MBY4735637.1 hypothetical protein [Burkholderia cepacia]MBY4745073.1 hypothetical protein [Burkholderia cepacia]MBY4756057.1 hypothetical protein [Burkholderia cepacia]MBY4773567.1 hypothetical protein [Burkholderia cepacia]
MNYRPKTHLGMIVAAVLATAVVFAASMNSAEGIATSAHGLLRAQQR